MFGLKECPKGTSREMRLSMDEDAIVSVIQQRIPSFNSLCIRDCYRLGQYSEGNAKPRPVLQLVTLTRAIEVKAILYKRFSDANIYIRPDLSPQERHTQFLLQGEFEHRSLINTSSTDRSDIKIYGNKLFIAKRLHARVENGILIRGSSLGDHSSTLRELADTSKSLSSDAAFTNSDSDDHKSLPTPSPLSSPVRTSNPPSMQ